MRNAWLKCSTVELDNSVSFIICFSFLSTDSFQPGVYVDTSGKTVWGSAGAQSGIWLSRSWLNHRFLGFEGLLSPLAHARAQAFRLASLRRERSYHWYFISVSMTKK